MKMILASSLMLFAMSGSAVVIRHDVPAEDYALDKAPGFLVDMPHEGSGVLIDEHWILSAAHTVFYDYTGKSISIQGVESSIESVVFHPGYELQPAGLDTGDATGLMAFLGNRTDLVLLRLSEPVEHVEPIERYAGHDEAGMTTVTYGKGATGTGLVGQNLESKQYRTLNHFRNRIESAEGGWLRIRFDEPGKALPLEGFIGSGDSGGPTVVEEGGKPYLVGITCYLDYEGDMDDFVGGVYGMVAVLARVSAHKGWIDNTMESYESSGEGRDAQGSSD